MVSVKKAWKFKKLLKSTNQKKHTQIFLMLLKKQKNYSKNNKSMRTKPRPTNEIQKLVKLVNIFILIVVISVLFFSCSTAKKNAQIDNVKLNSRINELLEIGYTLKASQKIAFTEFGILKADREYNGLIND